MPMPKLSIAKKSIAAAGAAFALFFFLSPIVPWFLAKLGQGDNRYVNLFEYYRLIPENKSIAFLVIMGISSLLFLLATFFFLRCVKAKPLVGDKEDKMFVFGYTLFTLSCALAGAICFSMGCYVPMFCCIAFTLIGVGMLILHFKVLSDI